MATIVEPEIARAARAAPSRHGPLVAAATAVIAIVALYALTAESIVRIWIRSETFAHGFVVVPLALWLGWRQRDDLRATPVVPWYPALGGVLAAGALWWVSAAGEILGGQQFALVFMVQAAIVAIAGLRVARVLAFPLAFVLFAVPFGEFLIPTLIEWTANFTVAAVRASGVPVFREGNHFIVPSGAWSVVEACSGIRYLIASLMVGTLYAELTYRSMRRKLAFIGLAIAVPIVANWLRAYGIVMLGHLSNNRLAVGVDHLIYGWLFFGVVMALLFWIAAAWAEPQRASAGATAAPLRAPRASDANGWRVALLAVAAAAVWRSLPALLSPPHGNDPVLAAVAAPSPWIAAPVPATQWKPHYSGYAAEHAQGFRNGEAEAGLYVAYYREQSNGRELVTSTNGLVTSTDLRWNDIEPARRTVRAGDRDIEMTRSVVVSRHVRFVAYQTYWVNGRMTPSPYAAKALYTLARLAGRGDDSALIVLYAPFRDDEAAADARLRELVGAIGPALERMLDETARGAR